MKPFFLLLAVLLLFSVSCVAGQQTLSWDLSPDDASLGAGGGYRVYQSTVSGQYGAAPIAKVVPGVSTVTFNTGTLGTFYWVVTAIDSNGNESKYSNEVSGKVVPGAPSNVKILGSAVATPVTGGK